jgi:hypothetical protein
MNIGANDMSSMVSKSMMAGVAPQAPRIAKTEEPRDVETVHEPEDTHEQTPLDAPPPPPRRFEQRVGRESVAWQEAPSEGALPGSLRPQARGASTAGDFNIPFWLHARADQQPRSDSPIVAQRRLLNGLRSMVYTEIQQYTPKNKGTYDKQTLRDFYEVLGDNSSAPAPTRTAAGDPVGLNARNWGRASSIASIFDDRPEPGSAFEMVA